MERQNRLLTILMIVLLGMLVVVLIQRDDKDEPPADPDAIPTSDLFDYENKDITGVKLKSSLGVLRFVKEGESWKQVEPSEQVVESRKVEEIVERLNSLKIEDRSLSGPLADYGLDEAQAVEVTLTKADNTTFTVLVGRDSPVGYRTYVKTGDGVTVGSTRIADLVKKGPDDFRNREVWSISSYSARRIRIEQGGQVVMLVKVESGWRLGDGGPRANKETVDAWLGKASGLKVAAFLEGQDDTVLGLLAPSAVITVEDAEGSHSVQFGAREADGVVARVGSGPAVRLGSEALEILEEDSWLSDKLVGASRYLVDSVELKLGERSWRFVRQEGAWADENGKPVNIDAFLEKLEGVTVDRSKSDLPVLSEGWGKITLGLGEGASESIQLGQADGSARLARESGGGPVFRVEQVDLDALGAALPK